MQHATTYILNLIIGSRLLSGNIDNFFNMVGSRLCSVMNRLSSELLVKNPSNDIPLLCHRVSLLKAQLPINCLQSLRAADIVSTQRGLGGSLMKISATKSPLMSWIVWHVCRPKLVGLSMYENSFIIKIRNTRPLHYWDYQNNKTYIIQFD
jgi:hypothetical protein